MQELRTREVLQSVLLQSLKGFSEGESIRRVYERIEENFAFPSDWMREIPQSAGYKALERRGLNWRDIPQDQLVQMVSTEPQWQNEIRWARNDLRKMGYLDPSAPRGIWRLTPNGVKAAENALDTLTPTEKKVATPRKPSSSSPSAQQTNDFEDGQALTTRERLEKNLALLTSSMPLEDLELLVDIARSVRLRSVNLEHN